MKKIIIAFDGTHFSEGAFEFARKLNELQPILLTAVCLPQAELVNLWSYADELGLRLMKMEGSETEAVRQHIRRFEKQCQNNNICYQVHEDLYDFPLPELKKESRFADLLILGSEVFYQNMGIYARNDYLKDVLHDVACPVVVVPEKFEFPQSIILAYDGSEDSVFAIRQFAYLFPGFSNKQTLLVFANEDPEEDIPEKALMEELATRHFSNLSIFKLSVDPKRYFSTWILDKNSPMLVCGSYGRSGLSQLFSKSFVKDVIADHQVTVFIAHK